jgi:large subunit ribosomal protein L21
VLLTDSGSETKVGTPAIAGAKVTGSLESIGKNKKVMVVKYKQKSRYFKSNGHQQPHFKVKITSL